MIFGRKNKPAPEAEEELEELPSDADQSDDPPADLDVWGEFDLKDWREDGPFDISEVDLDADDVERLDLGSVVVTPFNGMQMQLQADEETKKVSAILIIKGESALEVALFATPRNNNLVTEFRQQITAEAEAVGGTIKLAEGPFGTEIQRRLPVTSDDGQKMVHISRVWLVQGPRWLLRGSLIGRAGQKTTGGTLEGVELELYECFANLVIRRGDQAVASGDLIAMDLPEGAQIS